MNLEMQDQEEEVCEADQHEDEDGCAGEDQTLLALADEHVHNGISLAEDGPKEI